MDRLVLDRSKSLEADCTSTVALDQPITGTDPIIRFSTVLQTLDASSFLEDIFEPMLAAGKHTDRSAR